jgi:hypothetical protein
LTKVPKLSVKFIYSLIVSVMSDEEVELQDLGPDAEEVITPPLRAKRNIVRPKWLSPYEVTPLNRRGRK